MVLDHFGTPLGVGPFAGTHDEIFPGWADDIAAHRRLRERGRQARRAGHARQRLRLARPTTAPTVDEFVAAQARWYHHTIEAFGPERCMFESNFPVDKLSLDSATMWNGLKNIASRYTDAEQDAMFSGTARRIYRL